MIKQIFLSLVVTLTVSALTGYGLSTFLGFWQGFTLTFVIQYITFFIYNNYRINKQRVIDEQILNERLDLLSRNLVRFLCPCGNKVFEEVVYINEENVFKCNKCSNDIEVGITLSPIIKTQPLNVEETYENLQKVNQNSII